MRANGGQLTEITSLIDDGIIRPVVDRVDRLAPEQNLLVALRDDAESQVVNAM
jgi:hypothetical protein